MSRFNYFLHLLNYSSLMYTLHLLYINKRENPIVTTSNQTFNGNDTKQKMLEKFLVFNQKLE